MNSIVQSVMVEMATRRARQDDPTEACSGKRIGPWRVRSDRPSNGWRRNPRHSPVTMPRRSIAWRMQAVVYRKCASFPGTEG